MQCPVSALLRGQAYVLKVLEKHWSMVGYWRNERKQHRGSRSGALARSRLPAISLHLLQTYLLSSCPFHLFSWLQFRTLVDQRSFLGARSLNIVRSVDYILQPMP